MSSPARVESQVLYEREPLPDTPLGPETREAFLLCFAEVRRVVQQVYSHIPKDVQEQTLLPGNKLVENLFLLLQTLVIQDPKTIPTFQIPAKEEAWGPVRKFLERPEIRLIHFVRLMVLLQTLRHAAFGERPYVLTREFEALLHHYRSHHSFDLRELGLEFHAIGLDKKLLGEHQLNAYQRECFAWPPEAVWPYWAEHLDQLDQALQSTEDAWLSNAKRNAFGIIAKAPEVPAQFTERLWGYAFNLKAERTLAQDSLGRAPDILQGVLSELASSDADRRTIAAQWLGRLRLPAAIQVLISAIQREVEVKPRAAMLAALDSLGGSLEPFLDRNALTLDAAHGLAKGIPTELDWFPFPDLPQLHWKDTDEQLAPEIAKWWIIENFKLRNPEPGPLLRRFAVDLVASECQSLGRFVLEKWINQEGYTRKGPIALTCKGILAVAAVCCGAEAPAAAGRYLAKWPRDRAGQCRALIQMLAWVDHPAAAQLLLAVSSHFRPATIQAEAQRLSLALAERKNWTLEQMADRAIPSAGLDDKCELLLSYGTRNFIARLDEKLDFIVTDDSGKPLKALPALRKSDDEKLGNEARRNFSTAKKELKSLVQIQRQRLYEAMCVQRTWNVEEWNLYLRAHPVMRHLCQRLVWTASREGVQATNFRVLADGTLTDANDNVVHLGADDCIGLAHHSKASSDDCRTWMQHLADYEIEPLFRQFDTQSFVLSPHQAEQNELHDFLGHMVEAFTLRGKAGKLGYSRGPAIDGPWFREYLKGFPNLGINAVITFTGNTMPEENRVIALIGLHFDRVNEPDRLIFDDHVKLPLGKVPPVLLCECWNDLRVIAGAGTGFDPEWEKKTEN